MAETPSFRTGYDYVELKQKTAGLVWDVDSLSWVKATERATGFNLPVYDYAALATATTTDTWTFFVGGSGGTLVATIVIAYTDATKVTVSSVTKT